jgi:SAM-dependent methyltransferase
MTDTDRDRWDSRYAAAASPASPPAATLGWLPSPVAGHDHALDLACGTGRHTRALLAAGYRVVAADISRVALAALRASIAPPAFAMLVQLDVDAWPFAEASFDLVVQIDFLDRDALAAARRSVKPGGLLLLDTFAGPPRPGRPGPRRGAWRLDHGELATRFADWEVVRVDDEPARERAAILARRPVAAQPLR